MTPGLPKLADGARPIPDWPGYAIDRNGDVWRRYRKRWDRIKPCRTSAGFRSVWLFLPGGNGTASRRVADIYQEVFDESLSKALRDRQISRTGRLPKRDG